jgi:hypothetical protein
MKRKYVQLLLLILAAIFLVLSCSDLTNPFLDVSHAKASVKFKTFKDKDTVSIFSGETLAVVVYLKEHVKEVLVHIDNNRFFSNPDTVFQLVDFSAEPLVIPFSFYNTGWQNISVVSRLVNGDSVIEAYSLYARTPLNQKPISGRAGDTAILKTGSVQDEVLYVWDFLDGTIIKDYLSEINYPIRTAIASPIGELYVTDRKYRSPSEIFTISSGDSMEYGIRSLDPSIVNDSVYTGTSDYVFTVLVTGAEQLTSATVNGIPFDNIQHNKAVGIQLSKTFNNIDTLTNALRAAVKVVDNIGRTVSKAFFIHYVEGSSPDMPVITIKTPLAINDTAHTMNSSLKMYGTITGHSKSDSLYLRFTVNGTVRGSRLILANSVDWDYSVNVNSMYNIISLELFKDLSFSGSKISQTVLNVKYDPSIIDNEAPVISKIKVNDIALDSGNRFVSRVSEATFKVLVSDNKKVTKVTVDGNRASVQDDSITYFVKLLLTHSNDTMVFAISAEDSIGNIVYDTIKGIYNRVPQITQVSIPSNIKADSTHVFVIKTRDDDINDKLLSTVKISRAGRDIILVVKNDSVSWRPTLLDTGAYKVTVRVMDDFYESVEASYSLNVFNSIGKPLNVKLLTKDTDIPDSVIVGTSPLSVLMKVDPLTGTAPFTYKVIMAPSTVLYEGTNAQFSWAPKRSDAGLKSLKFIVTDNLSSKDSLEIMLNVIALPAAQASFMYRTLTLDENGGIDSIEVLLSHPLNEVVNIPYLIDFKSASASDIVMPVSGIVSFQPGNTSVKIPGTVVNDQSPEADEIFTITLSGKDSVDVEKNKSSIDIIIKDDDRIIYSFVVNAASGVENVLEYKVGVKLDRIPESELVVTCSVDEVKTTAGSSDYNLSETNKTLVFKPGQDSLDFKFTIFNDLVVESDEVVVFKLQSSDSKAIAGDNPSFAYSIVDDDGVKYNFVGSSWTEGESGNDYTVVVSLTKALQSELRLEFLVDAKSTASKSDYHFLDNEHILVFKPGQTTASFKIFPTKDLLKEEDESVFINLKSSNPAVVAGEIPTFTYTIKDDDGEATAKVGVMLQPQSMPAISEGQNFTGEHPAVMLQGTLSTDLTVTIKPTAASTAKALSDYTISTLTIVVPAGQTLVSLGFKIQNDNIYEVTEFVEFEIISISDPVNAFISDQKKTKLTIEDNDTWGW